MIINDKFTKEEVKEIETTMFLKAFMGICDAPETQEEFDKWCEECVERYHENKRKEKEKEERKLNNKIAKANEMGLTFEEYEEYKRRERNYKRHLTEIKKCKKEIERLMKEIEYHENKANYWKETL